MTGWIEKELGEVLTLNYGWSLPSKVRTEGEYPVYGSNGIVGSHDTPLVSTEGLIVGRKGSAGNVHYSRKPFCPIDTTFFITQEDTNLDIEFLYFLLLHIDLKRVLGDVGVPGLNREVAYKEKAKFPSNKSEQRRIAHVLTTVQTAIEQQAKLIDLTRELKSALMKKLFTEGLRGEKQKETEIGFIPESWSVEKLSSLFMIKHGFGFKGEYFKPEGVHVLLTPGHFYEEGGFRDQGEKTKYYTGKIPDGFILREGDLLIAMTEQKAGLLGSSIIIPESDKYLHNQRLGLIQNLDSRIIKAFLFYYFNTSYPRRELFSTATGSKVRHTSPSKVLSLNIAFPKVEEQEQIVQILKTADQKLTVMNEKKLLLEELFRTLLHQLMTGQVRVKDLDI